MRTSSGEGRHKWAQGARSLSWKFIPVLFALGMAAPAFAASTCGSRPCVSPASVVSAAGDDFRAAIAKVEFVGDGLSPQSQDAVATIAKTWAAKSKKVLSLRVHADTGMRGAAARMQAGARAQALTQALVGAGLPEKQIKVVH